MSEPMSESVSLLISLLTSADRDTRIDAAERLCRAGEAAAMAAVPLIRACGDADSEVKEQAVAALEELGPPPTESLESLVELAANEDHLVAYWAITLLGRSGKAAANAASILAERLGPSSDPAVAERAAWALGKIGPAAAMAVGALQAATTSSNPRLARLAQEAVSAIGE